MGQRTGHRRMTTAVQVVLVVLVGLAVPLGVQGTSAAAPPAPVPSASAIDAAPDYFEENWANPLDYSSADDFNMAPMTPSDGVGIAAGPGLHDASVAGGVATFTANGGGWYDLAQRIPGALPVNEFDTGIHPIDANRYKRFQTRIWSGSSQDEVAAIFWFSCHVVRNPPCKGARILTIHPGWQTIDFVLAKDPNAADDIEWAGQMEGLRFYPHLDSGRPPVQYKLDWIRLAAPTADLPVSVGAGGQVYWDTDQNPNNNAGPGQGSDGFAAPSSAGTVMLPVSRLAPGTYYVYEISGGQTSPYSTPITVHPRPQPVVIDPDVTGGEDYATAVRGDAWDFSQTSDLAEPRNFTPAFNTGAGVLLGSTAGPSPGDPQVVLPQPAPIDAVKYHHLSFRAGYQGTFGLGNGPGGGMLARFIWQVGGGVSVDGNDMVVYPGDFKTVSVDLKTNPPGAITDDEQPSSLGWGGPGSTQVTNVRFDPHEDPGNRSWALDYVRLAANDAGSPRFSVKFQDNGWKAGTTADLFVDSDNNGYNGTKIANGIPVTAGVNTFDWGLQDHLGNTLPAGTYWVYVVLHDPLGATSQSYSTGQVDMPSQPAAPPSAPQNLTAVAGLEQATVSWSAPASAGGAPITNYRVTVNPGGGQLTLPVGTTSTIVTGLTGGTPYTFSVVALNSGGAGPPAGPTAPVTPTALPGTRFHPVVPYRLLDSRTATGGWNGAKLGALQSRELAVRGTGGDNPVPASASAVVLNVTATDGTLPSFATVYPAGAARPNPSNLNFGAGQTIPNLVTAKVGARDSIAIFNANGEAHFVADVVGYYDSGAGPGDLFNGLTPKRLLDSRGANGGFNGALGAGIGNLKNLRVRGADTTIPATATAVVMNVTATQSSDGSFLRVWPKGEASPSSSNLNFGPGQTIPNLVVVQIGADDSVSFYNNVGTTHVVADVLGYFDPTAGGGFFHSMAPVRILDDRTNTGGYSTPWGPSPPNAPRPVQVTGANGIPAGATGVVMNTTVTNGTAGSLLKVYPQGVDPPISTNLNFGAGQTIPNLVMTQLPPSGQVSIANLVGTVDVIGDVSGYFASS